jgi:hypothetical protein
MVLEEGTAAPQAMDIAQTFAHQAVQTGSFRRGNPIVDPLTQQTVGYEMEALISPVA